MKINSEFIGEFGSENPKTKTTLDKNRQQKKMHKFMQSKKLHKRENFSIVFAEENCGKRFTVVRREKSYCSLSEQ